MKTVLVVDDEKLIRWSLCEALRKDFLVVPEASAEDAINVLGRLPVDAVVTDLKMSGMSGVDFVGLLRERFPEVPVLVISAFAHGPMLGVLKSLGVRKCFSKPFETAEVRRALLETLGSNEVVTAVP